MATDESGRVGQRGADAVGAFTNGGLDVLDHDVGVVDAGAPDGGHAEVGSSGVDATLHDGPERAVVRVGDDVEGEVATLGLLDGFFATGVTRFGRLLATGLLARITVVTARSGDHGDREKHGQPTEVLLHFVSPSSGFLWGAVHNTAVTTRTPGPHATAY